MIVHLVDGRVKGFARSGCTRVVPTFASQMSIVIPLKNPGFCTPPV